MITTTDAVNIVYDYALSLGLPVYQRGNIPRGEVDECRVTIYSDTLTPETYWNKCYIMVNLSAPDIEGEADRRTLQDLERAGMALFESIVGEYDGTTFKIKWAGTNIEEDKQLRCHYVNLRLMFNILNVK